MAGDYVVVGEGGDLWTMHDLITIEGAAMHLDASPFSIPDFWIITMHFNGTLKSKTNVSSLA